MGAKDDEIKPIANVINRLNSWDRKRMDEPDYETRLGAFKELNAEVREMKAEAAESENGAGFLMAVIHNCSYYMSNVSRKTLL